MDRVSEGITPMLKCLEEHIVDAGLADMMVAADLITQDSEKYVERLLALFNQFSQLVKQAFDDDPRFLTARDKAYKHVVNDTSVFRLDLPTRLVPLSVRFLARMDPFGVFRLGQLEQANYTPSVDKREGSLK